MKVVLPFITALTMIPASLAASTCTPGLDYCGSGLLGKGMRRSTSDSF